MELSIIVLTWNSKFFLRGCLNSLKNTSGDTSHEIIVIDNGSNDGTQALVVSEYPYVTFIRNECNRGVSAARNQGLNASQGNYLVILDVDTIVLPGAIQTLVHYLTLNPDVGLVAPKLIDKNRQLQYTCREFPNIASKFLRRLPFKWAQKRLDKEEYRNWDHNTIKEVGYVIGACQMIRRDAFVKVGFLDDKIFYGPEDIDYCLRVWQAGYKVVYNPNAVIIHEEQRITKKICSRLTWEHVRGLAHYFLKHKYLFSRERLYKTFQKGK